MYMLDFPNSQSSNILRMSTFLFNAPTYLLIYTTNYLLRKYLFA
jgi:hypothetical protein